MVTHEITLAVSDKGDHGAAHLISDLAAANLAWGFGPLHLVRSTTWPNFPETYKKTKGSTTERAFTACAAGAAHPPPLVDATAVEAISLPLKGGGLAFLVAEGEPRDGVQEFVCVSPAPYSGTKAFATAGSGGISRGDGATPVPVLYASWALAQCLKT